MGPKPIIAEDLGYLTESVHRLRDDCGFPGMKVLEFGFDSRDGSGSVYLPHHYPRNSVVYVGTHDNDHRPGLAGLHYPGGCGLRPRLSAPERPGRGQLGYDARGLGQHGGYRRGARCRICWGWAARGG